MNEYELMYVLHPRLTPEEIEAAVERISALVTSPGGEILSVDQWGRRRLAYPIDRNMEGYYVLSTFKAPADVPGSLEGQLNLSEDVLRHLLIRGIIPYDEPPRDERVQAERERPPRRYDDRPPRGDDEASEDAPATEDAAAPVTEEPAASATTDEAAAAPVDAAEPASVDAAEPAPVAAAEPEAAAEEAEAASSAAEEPAAADEQPTVAATSE